MKPQLLLLTLLLVPTISESQTVCFQYAGEVISCDRENGRVFDPSAVGPESRSHSVGKRDRAYTLFPLDARFLPQSTD
jgi:hypothetical protein